MFTFAVGKNVKTMAIPYDSKEEGITTVASEPQGAYENAEQFVPRPHIRMIGVPEGCMTLERFGELFHQKLDACYARLRK